MSRVISSTDREGNDDEHDRTLRALPVFERATPARMVRGTPQESHATHGGHGEWSP